MPSARRQPRKPAAASSRARAALVVVGMHRSGTSAMARILSLAGGSLPEQVIRPGPDNPLGFWEPAEMVALNDAILASVGSRWDDVFGHRVGPAVWDRRAEHMQSARAFIASNYEGDEAAILKDPRASLMTRFWDEALRKEGRSPVYIIMVRHPLEVAASVAARGDASEATAVLAWAAYMLAVERDTRGLTRIFVDYNDLLSDWRGVLRRVEAISGMVRKADADADIDAFLSSDHRHHHLTDRDLSARTDLWEGSAVVLGWMRAAAAGVEPVPDIVQEALTDLERLASILDPALKDLRQEAAGFPAVRAELAEARDEVKALRALCNQFHAEADHNGRHWEASRGMVAHLTHELAQAKAATDAARHEARATLLVRHELALAETRALRQQSQNRDLIQALEEERSRAAAARAERAAAQDYIVQLVSEREALAAALAAAQGPS